MPQMRLIDSRPTARLPPSQILLGISGSNWGCKVSPQPCHELVKLLQNVGLSRPEIATLNKLTYNIEKKTYINVILSCFENFESGCVQHV